MDAQTMILVGKTVLAGLVILISAYHIHVILKKITLSVKIKYNDNSKNKGKQP